MWLGALGMIAVDGVVAVGGLAGRLLGILLAIPALFSLLFGLLIGGALMAFPLSVFLARPPEAGALSVRRGLGRLSGLEPLPDAVVSGVATLAMQLTASRRDDTKERPR